MRTLNLKRKRNHISLSAVRMLRIMEGTTITELAAEIGVEYKAICRIEEGHNCQIVRYQRLAKYFHVTVDALVKNDIEAIASSLRNPVRHRQTLQEKMKKIHEECSRVGNEGERLAFLWELKRIEESGSTLAYLVNPNCADDRNLGFDMLSFTADKKPVYIEVKATKFGPETPFHITRAQHSKAEECLEAGIEYQIHRIVYVDDPEKRVLHIISARQLLKEANIVPTDYQVTMTGGLA